MKTPSLLLAFTPIFIHTISLFHFVIHLGINIIKTCYKLCTMAIVVLSCIFRLLVRNNKAIWPISHFTEHTQSKEDIHMYRLIN